MMYRILGNYEYTGALVQQKKKTIVVGSGSRRTVPREERFITEDHHEAIISKEEFERGWSLMRRMKKGGNVNVRDYPLADILYCGNCGLHMAYPTTAVTTYVKCRHKSLAGKASACTDTHYPTDKIDYIVKRALTRQLRLMEAMRGKLLLNDVTDAAGKNRVLKDLDKSLTALKVDKTRADESYASGVISKEEYIKKRDHIRDEIDKLKDSRAAICGPAEERKNLLQRSDEYLSLADRIYSKHDISREVVDAFLERIDIYDVEHIKIKFKFDDVFEQLVKETGEEAGACF